jgi:uncharacterized surface protein with fasciclin (FAS1) repeats
MLEHYEEPGWLKGNTWDVLKDRGNYSIFLEGIELAGFKPIVQGKSILTIMAPEDNAFSAYLSSQGYSKISDLEDDELKKLIGFHLLYYSYNKDRMVNFRPEGDLATEEDKERNAGMYYKFRTRSSNKVSNKVTAEGKQITIYHLERFVPVFSHRFFNSKNIDPKLNYEYFYPESTWTGNDGFNVSNASVKEYEILADNGYIYAIDKVLEPMETIYTQLNGKDDYSVFFDLYDSYSSYEYDNTLSTDFGKAIGVDSLYLHRHGSLPPIAMEWPTSSYQNISTLSSVSYSIFAPSNNALNGFFNRYWKIGGYESLNEVDQLVMKYMLDQYIYGGAIVFPEEISKRRIMNSYGTYFDFDPMSIKDKSICINGSFYGLDTMDTPPLFASIIGPAFRNKEYVPYLYALNGSSLLNSFVSSDVNFTMLMPSEEQLNSIEMYLMSYTTGKSLQEMTENGLADVSTSKMQSMVNMHTVYGGEGLSSTGTKVLATQLPFNYWFVKDGGITNNALFNKCIEPDFSGSVFVPFTEITNNGTAWSNGKTYSYGSADILFQEDASDGLAHTIVVTNDGRYPFNSFSQLLKRANMVLGSNITGLTVGRFIAFIPTNEAIATALSQNLIPGITNGTVAADGSITAASIDVQTLQNYLLSYFLRSPETVITTYPYPGSNMRSGIYKTASGTNLKYTDTGSALSVQLENRQEVKVIPTYDYFPFAYSDGGFHLIEAIL